MKAAKTAQLSLLHSRSLLVAAAVLAGLLVPTACARAPQGPPLGGSSTGTTGTTGTEVTGTASTSPTTPPPPPPSAEPTAQVVDFRITHDWGVPTPEVVVTNPLTVPIAPYPALPLPSLVAIYVGDHPTESPRYHRMSFYYRGGYPSYKVGYVAAVLSEGKGEAIPLQGNAFLRIGFTNAQAHNNSGASTIIAKPANPINMTRLRSYGFAGDFEGHVTYGLGLQVAPGSDQVLRVRLGQLKKSDGAGGFYYVVFVDVENP